MSKFWWCYYINMTKTAPSPRPSFSMYLFSPEPYKSRCGPEGSVCFTMFLHSHLHSQQAVCGPYALYSSFQREPCRSEVKPFTLGMGRDEHRHACKRLRRQFGVQYCKLFSVIGFFCFFCSWDTDCSLQFLLILFCQQIICISCFTSPRNTHIYCLKLAQSRSLFRVKIE